MKPYLTDDMKRALMCLMTITFSGCYYTILKLLKKSALRKFQHHQKYSHQVKEPQTSKITLSYPSGEKEAQNEDEQSDVSEESENYVIITLFTAT